jgi:hypothetical protein
LLSFLFNPYRRSSIWVNIKSLNWGVLGLGIMKEMKTKWEVNRDISVTHICTKICISWVVLSQLDICHSYLGSDIEFKSL